MKKFFSIKYLALFVLLAIFIASCSDDNPSNPPSETTPNIDSIAPVKAFVGFKVEIFGKNFGKTRASSIIKFGSSIIRDVDINEWTATKITMTLPTNLIAAKYKVCITVDGKESNKVDFEVLEKSGTAPVITFLSKKIATAGETIKIYGKHFGNGSGTSWVEFNGVKQTEYIQWTSTQIFLKIPANVSTGSVVVWVDNIPSNTDKILQIQAEFQLLKMITIKAGSFRMGDDNNSEFDNKPAHKVTFPKAFLMSETEITQKQWKTMMDNSNPSHQPDTGDLKPVQQVTFLRAIKFCNNLSKAEKYTPVYTINGDKVTWNKKANGYRLPTEAEWEYACRAGRTEDYTASEILNMAWIANNANGMSKEVKTRAANAFGLYDMLGNVDEWCWDYYDADYYKKSPEINPSGPETSDVNHRVIRGGSFVNGTTKCNSSIRNSFPGTNSNYNYNLGFRVVRSW